MRRGPVLRLLTVRRARQALAPRGYRPAAPLLGPLRPYPGPGPAAPLEVLEAAEPPNVVLELLRQRLGLDFQDFVKSDKKGEAKKKKAEDDDEEEDEGKDGGGGGEDNFWRKNQWYIFGGVATAIIVVPLVWSYFNNARSPEKETSWQSFRE
eukprot:EG_transcript_40187